MLLEFGSERRDEDVHDTSGVEELEPAFERRQQLDAVPECDTRMRIEADDGRLEPGRTHGVDDCQVPTVDAVEAADRDSTRHGRELGRVMRDPHESLASASSGGMIRSGSASSTENGPISVLRSATQWPPSASAIARMYVPDDVKLEPSDAVQ